MDGGRNVLDGTREKVQGVEDVVSLGHCWLGEVVVEKLDGVRVTHRLGHHVHHMEAAVVVEDGTNVEAFSAA